MPWRLPARRKLIASRVERAQMYALFDQLFPRQQELHADLEVAVLDRVTESVDLGPYALAAVRAALGARTAPSEAILAPR